MKTILAEQYDLIVIGGGSAGMAAALGAWQRGLRKILIVERDSELGGILNQCIHSGFGIEYFKQELTGPEYAGRFIRQIQSKSIDVRTDSMVLEITKDMQVHIAGKSSGYLIYKARSIVLATGCRERTRGAVGIAGFRPAGVITAGTAQRYVNIEGYMPGKRIVIVGSGDVGLIMARRLTLEGARVLACVELMPHSGGLARNISQCLVDFDIPLLLSHAVTEIRGSKRVEGVTISEVDENRRAILGTEQSFDCDTVLMSVGLIPENELANHAGILIDREKIQTSVPGVFVCGNALTIHDIVDSVTVEAMNAGAAAATFAMSESGC